jgi:hypothetical protein
MVSAIFIDQMLRLDKTLYLKLDKLKQRFAIYRKDRKNLPREILVIENNGEFCYPNRNHIDKLYEMDSWQNKNLIKDMDAHNESLDEEGDDHIHFLSNEMSKLATRTKYF